MNFYFKEIDKEDWDTLLEWRNDILTRSMSLNSDIIDKETHYQYMDKLNSDIQQKQFIFIHNNNKVGTIKETKLDDETRLSYSINPLFRNKGYGKLMMYLFLFDKRGIFTCEVKPDNMGSIKMCLWNNFNLIQSSDSINIYLLNKQ